MKILLALAFATATLAASDYGLIDEKTLPAASITFLAIAGANNAACK